MTAHQDACPACDGLKDTRAKQCRSCHLRQGLRLGSGQDWYQHPSLGYMVKSFDSKPMQYQHRYVMEQHLGRKLHAKEHVHHLNGDRTDNRIENLEVISASDHGRLHATRERMQAMAALGHAARWGE